MNDNYYIKSLLTAVNNTLKELGKIRRNMKPLGYTHEDIPEIREAIAKIAMTGRALADKFESDGILTPSGNGYLICLPEECFIDCNMFKFTSGE